MTKMPFAYTKSQVDPLALSLSYCSTILLTKSQNNVENEMHSKNMWPLDLMHIVVNNNVSLNILWSI